jgi:DNA-binding MarR family transcriptional regulator
MDLDLLEAALAVFSVLDPAQLPLHHVQLFLVVASKGSCTYREIEEALSLSNASVSRTINSLAQVHRTGREGHQLLVVHKDPEEGRRHLVSLSSRGKAILRQLDRI